MFDQVKHWMKQRANAAAWKGIAEWASSRSARFVQTQEADGFLIDQPQHALGHLRVEWGPSQRGYISGQEMRVRWELKLNPELQLMVIERELRDRLERAVFDAFTDTLQTRIETDTPEEMRWLVMFAQWDQWKSKLARARFSACAAAKEVAAAWLDGALTDALAHASQDLVPAGTPFVLQVQRGNLYLRMPVAEPTLDQIKAFVGLAEVAAKEAKRVDQLISEGVSWAQSGVSGWQSSLNAVDAS
ncbi:hypothetical protein [Inhella gelatinilytica]|uniref:Uncharacterized protein n=1 Tax=Inhella gelatinilytica TaxID=2795030 RepID=A0A931IZ28_9BURK|nr:hypothetical protein [Inhella gelatinilytica]MBH9553739.1 hypothetical protein [Inhella gelatinilytica]